MSQDLTGVINCCDTQLEYVKGHRGRKASIKNVVETKKTFHAEHRGHCEFCGATWVALYSFVTNQIEYRRDTEGTSNTEGRISE